MADNDATNRITSIDDIELEVKSPISVIGSMFTDKLNSLKSSKKIESNIKSTNEAIPILEVDSIDRNITPTHGSELLGDYNGLTENVKELAENSYTHIKRMMVGDEKVEATFDVLFSDGRFSLPPLHTIILMIILTCGCYGCILLGYFSKRGKQKLKNMSMIRYTRGKMAITNKGRLICWSENVLQMKTGCGCACCGELCRAPVQYDITSNTQIYLTKNVRQISQIYNSRNLFCCRDFVAGIEITFGEFNFDADQSGVIRSQSLNHFFHKIGKFFVQLLRNIEVFIGLKRNVHCVTVISGTFDDVNVGNVDLILEDLSQLTAKIVNLLPCKDIVVPNNNIKAGNVSLVQGFRNVTIVSDTGSIQIPSKWLPMLKGESIVASNGQVYKPTCCDYFLSVITLGYYYCKYVYSKLKRRSALILTTKRIMEVQIYHPNGSIPGDLSDVAFLIDSYFPGKIHSGYIASIGKGHLETGLETDGGELFFNFPYADGALEFVKALHMSTARAESSIVMKDNGSNYSSFTKLLPLMPAEVIMGHVDLKPSCIPACNCSCPCCCCVAVVDNILFTTNSLVTYTSVGNIQSSDIQNSGKGFLIMWVPLEKLRGHRLSTRNNGDETFCSRLFKDTKIGKDCCPVVSSAAVLNIQLEKFDIAYSKVLKGSSVNQDVSFTSIIELLSKMEASILNRTVPLNEVPIAQAIDRV